MINPNSLAAYEPSLEEDPILDETRPWERQPGEGDAPFHYFHHYYLSQSPPRSVKEGYKQWHRDTHGIEAQEVASAGSNDIEYAGWRKWATGWIDQSGNAGWYRPEGALTWTERARAHDDYMAALDRAMWMKRRQEVRERDWREGDTLRTVAMAVLEQAGNFVKRKEMRIPGTNGQPDQVIITVALDAATAGQLMKLGRDTQRLATDLSTENTKTQQVGLSADLFAQIAESIQGQAETEALAAAGEWRLIEDGENAASTPSPEDG